MAIPLSYELHPGDHIQIRRTIPHPERGQLRNGTIATITNIDKHDRSLRLELADGTNLMFTEPQIRAADVRLAYVQHPFPAQGHTTNTGHLIITDHTTAEGSYVALTRSREQTHLYATHGTTTDRTHDRLQDLAERMSRVEPEVPSIAQPLRHEPTGPDHVKTGEPEPRNHDDSPARAHNPPTVQAVTPNHIAPASVLPKRP